jgi:hypothetical protein
MMIVAGLFLRISLCGFIYGLTVIIALTFLLTVAGWDHRL